MKGLSIHLLSFRLNSQIISQNDKVRVSITTIPEHNKQSFVINAKDIHQCHHFFNINITDQTKKIIFVFRRKNFIQGDPIIASAIVHSDQFPKLRGDATNTEVKRVEIFEPLSNIPGNFNPNEKRKLFGQMQIQFSLENPFENTNIFTKTIIYNAGKNHNGEGYSKVGSTNADENANQNENNSLFVDVDF